MNHTPEGGKGNTGGGKGRKERERGENVGEGGGGLSEMYFENIR